MKTEKERIAGVKKAEEAVALAAANLTALVSDTIGPCMAEFNIFFKKYGICRLQYFGGSLQGEDINTILSSTSVIKEMTAILRKREFTVAADRTISFGSDEVAADFVRLGVSFGKLHCLYNRKAPLCRHELEAYPGWVKDFAVAFAEVLPKVKPTPKVHIITHHHMDILALKGSVGFETEQGMEGYHCE